MDENAIKSRTIKLEYKNRMENKEIDGTTERKKHKICERLEKK
jgi:hypothetical protein